MNNDIVVHTHIWKLPRSSLSVCSFVLLRRFENESLASSGGRPSRDGPMSLVSCLFVDLDLLIGNPFEEIKGLAVVSSARLLLRGTGT